MSICRYSSANWACDVYCYEAIKGGYSIHVAANRIIAEIPKLPRIGSVDSETYMEAYRAQKAVIDSAPREAINGGYDGNSFDPPDAEECLQTLLMLRKAGYRVPAFALEEVEGDLEGMDP